ncbi:hypothetical protein [Mycobacteroides abscessus]|uniref:hypothetical protein n=1 Tax=Mycobacteroides abscessus TaxID=36809 RepID=UPI001041CA0B|nr:hypothetical protein [Mycobacteroides abscessus]
MRIFDRAVEDCLSMRALAQHSKLMDGVEGAEFGDYQPINLDSDEVLKHATINLPRMVDVEKHWAYEVLRSARMVETLLTKSDQAFKDADDALASTSRHRMDRYYRYRDLANGYASDARMVEENGRLDQLRVLERGLSELQSSIDSGPRLPADHHLYDQAAMLRARINTLKGAA